MKFTFACKKISLNDSIKEYAEKKISKLDKYFPEEADAFVTFAVEKKNRCVVELTIRSANGTLFRAQTEDPARRDDAYSELCSKRSRGRAVVWALQQGGQTVCTPSAPVSTRAR